MIQRLSDGERNLSPRLTTSSEEWIPYNFLHYHYDYSLLFSCFPPPYVLAQLFLNSFAYVMERALEYFLSHGR